MSGTIAAGQWWGAPGWCHWERRAQVFSVNDDTATLIGTCDPKTKTEEARPSRWKKNWLLLWDATCFLFDLADSLRKQRYRWKIRSVPSGAEGLTAAAAVSLSDHRRQSQHMKANLQLLWVFSFWQVVCSSFPVRSLRSTDSPWENIPLRVRAAKCYNCENLR